MHSAMCQYGIQNDDAFSCKKSNAVKDCKDENCVNNTNPSFFESTNN